MIDLRHGDCLAVLATLPDSSVDAVVTDPPYELAFMGRSWDRSGIAFRPETWAECLRVLKPGGHLLAFGGTRTFHRLACAVEDAGFEIRDSIAWLYGSGFPKSLNLVDEQGEKTGWGTALKPAFEPIIVGRKPLAGTVAANVRAHGTGALSIDACRVGPGSEVPGGGGFRGGATSRHEGWTRPSHADGYATEAHTAGRWPANVVLDGEQAAELDEQSGTTVSRGGSRGASGDGWGMGAQCDVKPGLGDTGGASRFFPVFRYQAKAPKRERPRLDDGTAHPTVKPLELMRWLVRLVTPPGGLVLDPFLGSGTTAEACLLEGFRFIGCDQDADSMALTGVRLAKHEASA